MKLIDLLVQELPKRGGWPDGANYAVQDADGTVKFAKTLTYLHYLAGKWISNEDGHDWIHRDKPFEGNFVTEWTADDNHGAVIAMYRYECEISKIETGKRLFDEWSGEGIPPIGCECEYFDNNSKWYPVTIKYSSDQLVVISGVTKILGVEKDTEIAKDIIIDKPQFRPLRTEAERKRDAAVEAMQIEVNEGNNWIYSEYEIIYNAIAAGKIPGVKLDD
ncbi:hypothetical protein KGB38_gp08 [Salmonella phage vB_SenS_SB28]|uniref:Uncharacterized protein n=1 Tax=Salmonella phage vB_SenS_SB28 TaxID=2591136 RepID=A0A5J6TDJ5_9CAUD|nr:hypothetical protein KGB38_gp08 [Salmonella phage vB_SenS_SB28]QFG07749.1 hypothetical protein [Salmonella phage vB_SenS_SB28]